MKSEAVQGHKEADAGSQWCVQPGNPSRASILASLLQQAPCQAAAISPWHHPEAIYAFMGWGSFFLGITAEAGFMFPW